MQMFVSSENKGNTKNYVIFSLNDPTLMLDKKIHRYFTVTDVVISGKNNVNHQLIGLNNTAKSHFQRTTQGGLLSWAKS